MTNDRIEVQETHFKVSLPYGWIGGVMEEAAFWQYSARDKDEQLFISIYEPDDPISDGERPKVLESALTAGLQAEQAGARSDGFELSEPEKSKEGHSLTAQYSGYDPDRERRFTNLTIVSDKIIAGFYFEALDLTPEQFHEDSSLLLNAVELTA